MTHLDLFTGIGGFHLAAEWAGFETIGFSEIEPYCCQLLAEKWPEIPNYGDIRTADFSGLRGSITILSAGVPCQPASLAGKRRGEADDRWLWPAVLDVVESVQPAWCLLENPPGILTLDEFGGVLLRLESLGYQVRAFSVPANAVGAKHRRVRVFIVANADSSQWWSSQSTGNLINGSTSGREETPDRFAGSSEEALADSGSQRCEEWQERDGEPHQSRFAASCWNDSERRYTGHVADTASPRCSQRQSGSGGEIRDNSRRPEFERRGGYCNFRLTEPPLCRAADGISDRSHRLKALGNAVVPQQAYPFFAAIAQVINQ